MYNIGFDMKEAKDANIKEYNTWEVLKELINDPEMRFALSNDPEVVIQVGDGGNIVNAFGNQVFSIYDKWIELCKPVSFMDAFIALRDKNKDISCRYNGKTYSFPAAYVGEYSFNGDLIDYGEWYIK